MADMTPTRLGQVNSAGDASALFYKIFTGEVLTAFENDAMFLDKHNIRTIQNGKSAAFAMLGQTTAAYHTPGTQLLGDAIKANEKVITIDGLLVAKTSIANIDEAMANYDVRSPYSKEMGIALAQAFDKNVVQEGILGARASNLITGGNSGTVITSAKCKLTSGDLGTAGTATTLAEKAAAIRDALFQAATQMDIKNAPKNRYFAVRPAEFYALFQDTTIINSLYGNGGNIATGELPQIAGIKIVVSNNVPYTDLSGATYHGVNAAKTVGLVWTPEAIGTVKLMDLAMDSEFLIEYQTTLMVAKYAMGHGWLRCDALCEIAVA